MNHEQPNPYQVPREVGVRAEPAKTIIGFWALLSVFACIAIAIITYYSRGQLVYCYEELGIDLPAITKLTLTRAIQAIVTIALLVLAAIVICEKDAQKQRRKAFVVLLVAGLICFFYYVAHLLPLYAVYAGQLL